MIRERSGGANCAPGKTFRQQKARERIRQTSPQFKPLPDNVEERHLKLVASRALACYYPTHGLPLPDKAFPPVFLGKGVVAIDQQTKVR
jgi:hypothetical protein